MASPSSLFSVANKNVLITGGSRGIGYMIASAFIEHGANVLITSRDTKACEEAADKLRLLSRPPSSYSPSSPPACTPAPYVHHVASNVSTREGCKALAAHANSLFNGRLDVLINNAGTSWGEDPGYDSNARESGHKSNWGWDKVLDCNVKGVFYLTRECVPLLQRRRDPRNTANADDAHAKNDNDVILDPGRVINIGSVTGILPQDAPTHAYDVSKAALHHLTKKMASDLACRGITVNAIAPGYVLTRMSKGLSTWTTKNEGTYNDGDDDKVLNNLPIPLQRMGNGDDMGGACIYLSSRAGSYCTGTVLVVDGGIVGAAKIQLDSYL